MPPPTGALRCIARVRRMVSVDLPASALESAAIGLKPGRMSYFAGRAAPMGAVGAGVVTATFYNFSPSLVAHMIPRAWTLASPEQVILARFEAARASLTRLLGQEVIDSAEFA